MTTKKKSVPALRSRLMSALRKTWSYSPEYKAAIDDARRDFSVLSKLGKPMRRVHFLCSACELFYDRENVQVDHIVPVVPLAGFDSWDGVIARLFCPTAGLRIMCKNCHMAETDAERAMRQALKPVKEKKARVNGKRFTSGQSTENPLLKKSLCKLR